MKSAWNDDEAPDADDPLSLRAYSSRLIGRDPALVLHGGGNTSVKTRETDRFGATRDVLWVKASGYDLAKMGTEGFTALELDPVLRLADLPTLSDPDMVAELKTVRLDPDAAAPSIEAIVHGVIPFRYVDHTHADAVLTISNTPDGLGLLREIYGPGTFILPYVKPGFDLARQMRALLDDGGFERYDALLLEHHGVFTFDHDARRSYERMIEVVAVAERWLLENTSVRPRPAVVTAPLTVAAARRAASDLAGRAVLSLAGPSLDPIDVAEVFAMAGGGTLTPEHVIHNKPFPAMVDVADPSAGMTSFAQRYVDYFRRADDPTLRMMPPSPNWALFSDGATRSFGPNLRRASISADVIGATLPALERARHLGGWQGLDEAQLRSIEYWDLEQAKLGRQPADPVMAGKVAVVAGSASGIGLATAHALQRAGAAVVGLDVDRTVAGEMDRSGFEGIVVDLRDEAAVAAAIARTVSTYGGLDALVCCAGIFRTGAPIEDLADDAWDDALAINLTAHRKLLKRAIPFLRLGIDPGVVLIGSRNVHAPGVGAAAYSVSKAGLTQLMRVAALELAPQGIRVNAVHPDAVFDTRLWTDEALAASARRYGLTVDEYRRRNLLGAEIVSDDVARSVIALLDGTLGKTTGAQIPVDGGNDRVI